MTDELYGNQKILHHESNFKWEDTHRCLTGDPTKNLNFGKGELPLRLCIRGGQWLLGGGMTVTLVCADEIVATQMQKKVPR